MYGIYANIYHQYTPVMLANIPYDWILWEMELPRLQVMDEPTTAQLGDPGTIHIPDKPTKRCGKNTASCTDLFPRPEFMRFPHL